MSSSWSTHEISDSQNERQAIRLDRIVVAQFGTIVAAKISPKFRNLGRLVLQEHLYIVREKLTLLFLIDWFGFFVGALSAKEQSQRGERMMRKKKGVSCNDVFRKDVNLPTVCGRERWLHCNSLCNPIVYKSHATSVSLKHIIFEQKASQRVHCIGYQNLYVHLDMYSKT